MIEASIIIPVYNNAEPLRKTLELIRAQEYPEDRYEVIVVDNGSDDHLDRVVGLSKNVTLIRECKYRFSPYSARNRGIEKAGGEVIVLLDATCRPEPQWLAAGLRAMREQEADLVAGNVKFDFEGKITSGKIYDSLTNIQMKESVKERNVAKTANLFVRKKLFEEIGLFPEGVRSGADVRWTGLATSRGYKLVYCEEACVYKIARPFMALLRKQWRVGLAQPEIRREAGGQAAPVWSRLLPFPMMLKVFRRAVKNKLYGHVVQLVCISFAVWLIMALANIAGMLKLRGNKKTLNQERPAPGA